MSLSSTVPNRAIQQRANGLGRPASNTAAIKGAVVVNATMPPGRRTGIAPSAKVIAVQKKILPRSTPSGGGTETLVRTIAAALTTAATRSRSRAEGGSLGTGGKNSRGVVGGRYPARNEKRAPRLPSRALSCASRGR